MLSVPRTLALASTQISLVAFTAMASFLISGSITVFTFAFNLRIGTPNDHRRIICGHGISDDRAPARARCEGRISRYVEAALRHMIFWAVPATVFVIVMRAQIVRIILGGQFDWDATRLTAAALALFVLSLAAQSITLLIARAYYAVGNTKKPLYYGSGCHRIDHFRESSCSHYFGRMHSYANLSKHAARAGRAWPAVLMFALGYALGSIAEGIVSYSFFMHEFSIPHARISRLVFESFSASMIGAGVAYLVLSQQALPGRSIRRWDFWSGDIAGSVGLAVAAGILSFLRIRNSRRQSAHSNVSSSIPVRSSSRRAM